ncbi:family 10 glycosylhydrolase [Nibribacter ruber]|uniref:Family 10 glycosylhydrolase n=1 Tax=Nibribacter ruber TaxID=2698458 RepID=A0A6P1P017_9BACT|nr:alpha amylase family protein [Nibribacter ruber]QHL87591.1 family 10 glycosylhydrolase [Nibribacter ruber]
MKKSILIGALLVTASALSMCGRPVTTATQSSASTMGGFKNRNLLYFDATANFKRFSFQDSIAYYLKKSKDAGVTDVVVDVKPISGEVLYPSKLAPVMNEWAGFTKTEKFDLLTAFIEQAHKLGMTVHASTNIFVAGHNHFNRGPVYADPAKKDWQSLNYTAQGMTPITQIKTKYSAMVNPALPAVQQYEMGILKELITLYPKLDGIILDRVRYDGIEADFSAASRKMFEQYIGKPVANFPADIYTYSKDAKTPEGKAERVPGPLYKQWIEWRAKVIHDFVYAARQELKAINPKLIFGDYTGSWYPTYYEVGVNWASKEYDPSQTYSWATPNYKNFGYAEALDLYTTGSYYFEVEKKEAKTINVTTVNRTEAGQNKGTEDWYTVEGSAEMAMNIVKGKAPVYAGVYVDQYKGHPEQFVKALKMCRAKSDGAMVFDIVHVINEGWWNELKRGLTE